MDEPLGRAVAGAERREGDEKTDCRETPEKRMSRVSIVLVLVCIMVVKLRWWSSVVYR